MSMTITLEPEVERWLDEEAAHTGITKEQLVARTLKSYRVAVSHLSRRELDEAELLTRIREGLPASFWTRYRELIARREAEKLTEPEQEELIACSDRVEAKNAQRAMYLMRLAAIRGATLEGLISELGIQPVPVNSASRD